MKLGRDGARKPEQSAARFAESDGALAIGLGHVLCLTWLALIGACWLVGPLGGFAPWPLTLPANLLHVVISCGALLGLGALLARRARWLALALCVQPLALFGWAAAQTGLESAATFDASRGLRVVSANLGHLDSGLEPVLDFLRRVDADVVGLQELDAEMIAVLDAELVESYPHREFFECGALGRGLLAAYPIELADSTKFAPKPANGADDGLLCATVQLDDGPLEVVVAHVFAAAAVLGTKEPDLLALLDSTRSAVSRGRTLALGDFNATETSPLAARLRAIGLRDGYRAGGGGFDSTFPMRWKLNLPLPPIVRIDHVWFSAEFSATSARRGTNIGGDHLPIVVEVERR